MIAVTLSEIGTIALIASIAGAGVLWLGRVVRKGVQREVRDTIQPEIAALRTDLVAHTHIEEERFAKIEADLAFLRGIREGGKR